MIQVTYHTNFLSTRLCVAVAFLLRAIGFFLAVFLPLEKAHLQVMVLYFPETLLDTLHIEPLSQLRD
jgi:hypothetical protein